MKPVAVKICGLTRRPDAELAAASGARFGGVILAPGGRRSISHADAAAIFEGLPLRRVGVFVDAGRDDVLRAAELVRLDVIQLHGEEAPELAAELREDAVREVWKALRPRDAAELLAGLERYAGVIDGVLLDGWSADAPGGTGARFPWSEIAEHRHRIDPAVRFVVAGGLSPANVANAIEILRPDVVDVSSGVEESPGIKSATAVPSFLAAVQHAGGDPYRRT